MVIRRLNHAAIVIETLDKTIVFDPYDPEVTGLKWKDIAADIVCTTHDHKDHNYLSGILGDPFCISGPGEYEVASIRIQGYQAFHDDKNGEERGPMTLYVLSSEDMNIAHFGNLGHELTDDLKSNLVHIDVLCIPVDGVESLSPKLASKIIAQIEPSIVIPMHYAVKGSSTEELGTLEAFLKEVGVEDVKNEKKLKLKGQQSLSLDTEFVVLEPEY